MTAPVALLAGLLGACASTVRAKATSCLPADAQSARTVEYVTTLVTSAAADRVSLRTALGLPAVAASDVRLVTDARTCDSAVQGVNTAFNARGAARQLYVVKVGTYYAVQQPGMQAGEWSPVLILTRQYKYQSAVNAF